MELKQLLQLLQQKRATIIAVTVFAAILGGMIVYYQDTRYASSIDLYVEKTHDGPENGEYGYDGYYAQQVAEKYTDTVIGLIETKDTIIESLASLEREGLVVNEYAKSISVQKVAPQIITVSVTRKNPAESEQFVQAVVAATIAKVGEIRPEGKEGISINMLNESPYLQEQEFPTIVGVLVGMIVGLFSSISWILLRRYLES